MPEIIFGHWKEDFICEKCNSIQTWDEDNICPRCGKPRELLVYRYKYEKKLLWGFIPYRKVVGIDMKGV